MSEKIPDAVWNDLVYSDKAKVIDAVKTGATVNYFHTDRKPKIEKDQYKLPSDTDVISIKTSKDLSPLNSTSKNVFKGDFIFLRTTSERGIKKINNPAPRKIPRDIWYKLPDVAKENFSSIIKIHRILQILIFNYRFEISYYPMRSINPWHLPNDKDMIFIHISSGIPLAYHSSTDVYDAKNGLLIGSMGAIS
jgi:hypothetical protein